MSWLFSQVLVEEYLGDISLDGEQSVQSSGNPTQQAYCLPDKMTECSRLSRFGMMFKPLTEDRGEELLMSYLADFHAKTSPQPEREPELTESGQGCGEKWHGSFTRYDPDSSLWRTHQCSLLGDLEPYSGTWPQWGLMRNGECWERQMSELRTNATEFGLWRTPDTGGGGTSGLLKQGRSHRNNGQPIQIRLVDQVNNPRLWPKMTSRKWATPVANPAGGTPEQFLERKRKTVEKGNSMGISLTDLQMQVIAEEMGMDGRGSLNPMWVEWLMGWPLGWTDLKPLETDKFQRWLDEHGKS
jgi:hypothetical protein